MKPIGGYFELELTDQRSSLHSDAFYVNSGRNALEFILRTMDRIPAKVYLPYYTCDTVFEPLQRLRIPYEFYNIKEKLELVDLIHLKPDEYIIVNNYFGLQDDYIRYLYGKYQDQLIIDCTQAWYTPEIKGCKMFYSPRKYFGLPDGGIACTTISKNIELEEDKSYTRCEHLLRRIDEGAQKGYGAFQENSEKLVNLPLRWMSRLTKALLSSIDQDHVRQTRIHNYEYLYSLLKDINKFEAPSADKFALSGCPMVYPFLSQDTNLRKKLIANNIFVATYWPNVIEMGKKGSIEYNVASNLIPLPIDQRYGEEEMIRIINLIKK